MYYLSQPLTGLLTKTSQLFSGRVKTKDNFGTGVTELEYPAIAIPIRLAVNLADYIQQWNK